MSDNVQTGTISTQIPARLDRLPWSRFHWMVIIGLGTVWILDGLEVTIVGSVASRLTEDGSGIQINASQIGLAAAIYVTGACLGALFFGQLTDRFGRKKLFVLTLGVYIAATVATAFAFAPWYFFVCRFFTGAGIGGEYAAINSAIDELIPARVRGRVDLMINGSYWVGSAAGSALALVLLDTSIFASNLGWRLAFGLGAVLGLTILVVRRHVPESPRWLFIHGRQEEAEDIVDGIERDIREETGEELGEPDGELEVRQREAIPFREIARTAFELYPRRAVLGLSLFVGQAFIYNGITFNLGTLMSGFFGVASATVPVFIVIYAVGNFLGPLTLGRLFDTVGRKPMIAGCYLGSAAVGVALGALFWAGVLSEWSFIALVVVTFFLASAGASAAYLTVSEIFPMETRALAIAFFYAVGTAVGGITGPLLFGNLINTGDAGPVAIGFFIGSAVMAVGGIAELAFGVKAEQAELEDIAKPLTAEEAEEGQAGGEEADEHRPDEAHPERREALRCRRASEEERARASDHRARAIEIEAAAGARDDADDAVAERALASIADLHAEAHEQRARAHEERATADEVDDEGQAQAARIRAEAADERAVSLEAEAEAISADDERQSAARRARAGAAAERAQAREELAVAARASAQSDELEGAEAAVCKAEAELHQLRADGHEERAAAHEARGGGSDDAAAQHERRAEQLDREAAAAEERVTAARRRLDAERLDERVEETDEERHRRAERAKRERAAADRERRIRRRIERRQRQDAQGLRRFRPGPGRSMHSPTSGAAWIDVADDALALDREVEAIASELEEHGSMSRRELASRVGAHTWGPGQFRAALRTALEDGAVRRVSRSEYGPAEDRETADSR